MLIPSSTFAGVRFGSSLSRRVNANSQRLLMKNPEHPKLIKKGEC